MLRVNLLGHSSGEMLNCTALSSPLRRMIGMAGFLSLLALLFEGFSLDTFALPHLWVMLGLVTAVLPKKTTTGN